MNDSSHERAAGGLRGLLVALEWRLAAVVRECRIWRRVAGKNATINCILFLDCVVISGGKPVKHYRKNHCKTRFVENIQNSGVHDLKSNQRFPKQKFQIKASPAISNVAFLTVCFLFLWLFMNRLLSTNLSFMKWDVGDWLISFEAGLVRRGLFGEFLSFLGDLGVSPEPVLITFVMSLYAILFLTCFILFVCQSRTWPWFMILGSPAFLAFPVWLSVSPFTGAYKKELIVFAICSLISLRAVFKTSPIFIYIPIAFLFVVGCFSHEIVPLSLPLLTIMLFLYNRWNLIDRREAMALFGFLSIGSLLGIVFALSFPGTSTMAFQICRRAMELGYSSDVCGGAIRALWIGVESFTRIFETFLREYIIVYGACAALVLLPAFLIRGNNDLIIIGLAYIVCLLPLYPIGIDWGRWLSSSTTFFYLTILVRSYTQPVEFMAVPSWITFLMIFFWNPPLICVHNCHLQMQTFTHFSVPDPYTMDDYDEWLKHRFLAP
ncbi:hypothetical protein EI983_08355 [Roseovarius faecimaris]|uniref:Uncharacterized protein n=1 Tax=Roseovarius faecimaris TaxID=2494550 RepID=A0A6I6IQD9_9RHOB|nr:hypothetical protein [Roseovarius faecimaris]QGX98294.1 hypothetical protein EI983_08355 [Roseovarius faecimaris]